MENLQKVKIRLVFSTSVLFVIFSLIGFFVIDTVSIKKKINLVQKINEDIKPNKNQRGKILDRNGYILATTIETEDLIINPSLFKNPKETIKNIRETILQNKFDSNLTKVKSGQKYLKIKKNISKFEYKKILMAGYPGIAIEKSSIRKYPGENIASHIIGNVNTDGIGVSGIELKFQKELSHGKEIKLTLNAGVQNILRNLIFDQIQKFDADGGAGVLLHCKNGEIHALVSLPDYDNNKVNNLNNNQKFNKATKGIYELGSTLKIFNAAMALESGIFKDNDLIDVSKPLKISSKLIKDHRPLNFSINLPEVLVHSSNIGSAKIARTLGHEIQQKYINLLGFNKKINLEIIETGKPRIINDQRQSSIMTKSYGYGIQISPLHLATGTASVLNDGHLIKPKLVVNKKNKQENKKIFSDKTSKILRNILYLVVNDKSGTGKLANAPKYLVGGKTGTAEKMDKETKKYSKSKKIVAFTGAFPINNPKFAFTIMVDNPKPKKFSNMLATGGWVVAPIVKKFVTRTAPILGVYPSTNEEIKKFVDDNKYKIREQGYKSGI